MKIEAELDLSVEEFTLTPTATVPTVCDVEAGHTIAVWPSIYCGKILWCAKLEDSARHILIHVSNRETKEQARADLTKAINRYLLQLGAVQVKLKGNAQGPTGRTAAEGPTDADLLQVGAHSVDHKRVPGRAHTIEEKRHVLDRIYEAWLRDPDQRLGQFLINAKRRYSINVDLFDVQDDVLAFAVEELVK